jgi:hypothetical protein
VFRPYRSKLYVCVCVRVSAPQYHQLYLFILIQFECLFVCVCVCVSAPYRSVQPQAPEVGARHQGRDHGAGGAAAGGVRRQQHVRAHGGRQGRERRARRGGRRQRQREEQEDGLGGGRGDGEILANQAQRGAQREAHGGADAEGRGVHHAGRVALTPGCQICYMATVLAVSHQLVF